MCVRTVTGNETDALPSNLTVYKEVKHEEAKKPDKLLKAKEKFIKLHDDMIVRERKQRSDIQQEYNSANNFLSTEGVSFKFTVKFRTLYDKFCSCSEAWKHTKTHRIIVSSAQLAHLITILSVLSVASAVFPKNGRTTAGQQQSTLLSFLYLSSFIVHLGSQIWMTFVSGLSLYFALPRHTFSEIQRVLFPRYFTINACMSFITLLIFVSRHPAHSWDFELKVQVFGMVSAFFLELMIRLYMTPILLRLIVQKTSIEATAKVGSEIGHHNFGVLKHCPHYLKIYKTFRLVHSTIAVGNLCTMACTLLHLYYISSKLCIL
ncbi:transmembrane protein 205 [Leptopilina heterotoma]|uniref:transmembrane protein 205 n=1 Tax=Leptopilina heterotoma TaxID=63436 RepID=UPI001CA905CB|nr:transmembrane protein 205 [Leptopilina heterotoma]